MSKIKTLEEYVVNELETLKNVNHEFKVKNEELTKAYQNFLEGEFLVVSRGATIYKYGTRDSESYYGGILRKNSKDLNFAKECLTDKEKLYQFMGMNNGGGDHVCQLVENTKDIITTPQKYYIYENGFIKDDEVYLSKEHVYHNYSEDVIKKLKNYIANEEQKIVQAQKESE